MTVRSQEMTRPQSHTQLLHTVHVVQFNVTLHCGISYLFFAFILEAQTRCSFFKALAIVSPGLVRLQLHHGWTVPPFFQENNKRKEKKTEKKNPGKDRERERGGSPNQLTAEPPHRCCSLHPWSETISNRRRRRCYRYP